MRILHTSDLHLSKSKPETLKALEEILRVAKKENVEVVTIGGDMFHSERDANDLRPNLRPLLSNLDFKVYAMPGNHDSLAFSDNTYFGDDFEVAISNSFVSKSFPDAVIIAVPYKDEMDEDFIAALKKAKRKRKVNILLLHCTLDIGFSSHEFGEEKTIRYMPVTLQTMAELGYDFILGGHFHSVAFTRPLENGGIFVYPGSPISHTVKETGKRNVLLLDTKDKSSKFIQLDTFYFDELKVDVFPDEEDRVLKEIEGWIGERKDDNCNLTVIVNGFIQRSENRFNRDLVGLIGEQNLVPNYRYVKDILVNPLYKRFRKKLNDIEDLEERAAIDTIVLRIISRLTDEGRLSL